jgi:DNA-binding NarL/FixJ family response regulator
MSKKVKSRVFIVESHSLLRELLGQLIDMQQDMVMCGTAEDASQAVTKIHVLKPDIAIVGLSLKSSHGMDLIKDLQIMHPQLPLLVLAMQDESHFAERCLRAGARGYITTYETPDKALSAIRQVLTHGMYVSETLATRILRRSLDKPESGGSLFESLSDRELQVFELMGKGCGTQQIAKVLRLGVRTVNTYRSRIKEKLGLESSAALMRQAFQWIEN